MSYKCPGCRSTEAWEGLNTHCPEKSCQYFDEKLLNQILEEEKAKQLDRWDEDTQPYPESEKTRQLSFDFGKS